MPQHQSPSTGHQSTHTLSTTQFPAPPVTRPHTQFRVNYMPPRRVNKGRKRSPVKRQPPHKFQALICPYLVCRTQPTNIIPRRPFLRRNQKAFWKRPHFWKRNQSTQLDKTDSISPTFHAFDFLLLHAIVVFFVVFMHFFSPKVVVWSFMHTQLDTHPNTTTT